MSLLLRRVGQRHPHRQGPQHLFFCQRLLLLLGGQRQDQEATWQRRIHVNRGGALQEVKKVKKKKDFHAAIIVIRRAPRPDSNCAFHFPQPARLTPDSIHQCCMLYRYTEVFFELEKNMLSKVIEKCLFMFTFVHVCNWSGKGDVEGKTEGGNCVVEKKKTTLNS